MSRVLTGVGACLSAAHRSPDGVVHGHTWEIVAWWFAIEDATKLQSRLVECLAQWDHGMLPDALAWGESLATIIGRELNCYAVDVSRPSERIFARWERE